MDKKNLQTLINEQLKPQHSPSKLEKLLVALLNETGVEEHYDAKYTQNLITVHQKLLTRTSRI